MRWMLGLLLVAAMAPAVAHHSTAANFSREIVEVSGVIEEVRFLNPHASILVRVDASDEGTRYWLVETDARTTLERKGVTLERLVVGESITVSGRKGYRPYTMYLREATLQDGSTFDSGADS